MALTMSATRTGEGRSSLEVPDHLSRSSGIQCGVRRSLSATRPSARAKALTTAGERHRTQSQDRVVIGDTGRRQTSAARAVSTDARGSRTGLAGSARSGTGSVVDSAGATAPSTTSTSTCTSRTTTRLQPQSHQSQSRSQSHNRAPATDDHPINHNRHQHQERQPHLAASTSSSRSIDDDALQHHNDHRQHHSSSKLPGHRFLDSRRQQHETSEPGHVGRTLPTLLLVTKDLNSQHSQSSHNPSSPQVSPLDTLLHRRQNPRRTLADDPSDAAAHQTRTTGHQQHHLHHRLGSEEPKQDNTVKLHPPEASADRRPRLRAAASATELHVRDPAQDSIPIRDPSTLTAQPNPDASADTVAPERNVRFEQTESVVEPSTSAPTAPTPVVQGATATEVACTTLGPTESTETIVPSRPSHKRAPNSFPLNGVGTSSDPPVITPKTRKSLDSAPTTRSSEKPHGTTFTARELLPLKTVERCSMSDDRRASFARRPPISYKPPVTASTTTSNGGSAAVPPIRSFRSSGSRRSLTLDMNLASLGNLDSGDDYLDSNHRDRTLHALEGRPYDHPSTITPPDSALADTDDSGDVFLRIARQEPAAHEEESRRYGEARSEVQSRFRLTRRPMSAAVNNYEPRSPPHFTRRMSEKDTASVIYERGDDSIADRLSQQNARTLRGSPMTPRVLTFQDTVDTAPEVLSPNSRRRQPSVDTAYAAGSRVNSLKKSESVVGTGRSYHSSPLASKSADTPKHDTHLEQGQPEQGTNSTASTAAPSTVWDELDDLKSRIHRLELTGKLPPTSSAAISKATEERPPTAHTNATTMSASPKRNTGQAQAGDVASTTSSAHQIPKESHPVLHNALAKSKPLLSTEVYTALETAAKDALSLTSLMGAAGQPGPISSAASGVGGGPIVTDRQLRRKADSICRSITELCIALSDGIGETKPGTFAFTATPEKSPDTSPTITRFTNLTGHARNASALPDRNPMSPRASTRIEERRGSIPMNSVLTSPRHNPPIARSSIEASPAGRQSSLLLSRSRRAQTEEPEEARQTSLLRSRRTGSEEPEERRTLLARSRRAGTEEPEDSSTRKVTMPPSARRKTMEAEEEMSRLRSASRAITEVAGLRSPREYLSHKQTPTRDESGSLASSALPKRQLTTSSLASRIVQPTPPSSRRFLEKSSERAAANRDAQSTVEQEVPSRRLSLAHPPSHNYARRGNRESMIAIPSSTSAPRLSGHR